MTCRATPPASSVTRLAGAILCAAVFAAPPATVADPEPGWHIVRPGDTLEGIAKLYLGNPLRWPEIHRLNPGIDDPHWIHPGRRMRIVFERPSLTPNAQVADVEHRVEAHPEPVPWRPADEGDLLLERDGLRTYERSSARLVFDDGTTATVSEESLVFIRRQTPARAPAPVKEIEVVRGQTDLVSTPRASFASPEIEIVVAGAKSRSRAGADGATRSRARRDGDAAQFMSYEGKSQVAGAGGATVELTAGTGSVVAPQAPPSPPEPLLPAPRLTEPEDAGELARDLPRVRWQAVAGASAYVVEICADPACVRLLERRAGVDGTETVFAVPLPEGSSYWRVTAVAPSGLDGFPSATRRFVAVESFALPVPTISVVDANGGALPNETTFALPPAVAVVALDAHGRALPWQLEVDGVRSTPASLAKLRVAGHHEVAAIATDEHGREARSLPATFLLDLEPPRVELSAPVASERDASRGHASERADSAVELCEAGVEVESPGAGWQPVACGEALGAATEVALGGREATLRLRSRRALDLGDHRQLTAAGDTTLRAVDPDGELGQARLRLVAAGIPGSARWLVLDIQVVDRVGHKSSVIAQLRLR